MTARLVFSMPVHERVDAIRDSIRNILHFNPGALVVLHASKQAKAMDGLAEQVGSEQVFVNPRRHQTGHGTGMFRSHCSNYRYLRSLNVDFDTFCIISSNELFVRGGLARYAAEVKNAFQGLRSDPAEGWHVFEKCERHPKIPVLLRECGGAAIYGGHTEGQFYDQELFGEMCEIYERVFGDADLQTIETEEFVPQTIAVARGIAPQTPFTLADYSNLVFRVNLRAISLLSAPKGVGNVKLNLGPTGPTYLRNPHQNGTNERVFALKRIPRDPEHKLRKAVRELETREHGNGEVTISASSSKTSATALVPVYSMRRIVYSMIILCRQVGIKIPLNISLRTVWQRLGKRSKKIA